MFIPKARYNITTSQKNLSLTLSSSLTSAELTLLMLSETLQQRVLNSYLLPQSSCKHGLRVYSCYRKVDEFQSIVTTYSLSVSPEKQN